MRQSIWDSPEQAMIYERAVRLNPRHFRETPLNYIARIAEIVAAGEVPPPESREPGQEG